MNLKKYVVIKAGRDAYHPDQLGSSITVKALIEYLRNNFKEEEEVILSHDGGYTYGYLNENRIFEKTFDMDED